MKNIALLVIIFIGMFSSIITSAQDCGEIWTQVALPDPPEVAFYAVIWAEGQYVAVGHACLNAVSTDGLNWTWGDRDDGDLMLSLAYGEGLYVAGGTNCVYVSKNGLDWTKYRLDTGAFYLGVAHGNGKFIAVGGSQCIARSKDGRTWNKQQLNPKKWFSGIAFGNGRFVAVGGDSIFTSKDGITWKKRKSGVDWEIELVSIAYGHAGFVALGYGAVLGSSDGKKWSQIAYLQLPEGPTVEYLTYANGMYVGVGGGIIITSPDGVEWTIRETPNAHSMYGIAGSGSNLVAVGDDIFFSDCSNN